jgi:hypothetical protein
VIRERHRDDDVAGRARRNFQVPGQGAGCEAVGIARFRRIGQAAGGDARHDLSGLPPDRTEGGRRRPRQYRPATRLEPKAPNVAGSRIGANPPGRPSHCEGGFTWIGRSARYSVTRSTVVRELRIRYRARSVDAAGGPSAKAVTSRESPPGYFRSAEGIGRSPCARLCEISASFQPRSFPAGREERLEREFAAADLQGARPRRGVPFPRPRPRRRASSRSARRGRIGASVREAPRSRRTPAASWSCPRLPARPRRLLERIATSRADSRKRRRTNAASESGRRIRARPGPPAETDRTRDHVFPSSENSISYRRANRPHPTPARVR